jgi:hypothetical protein
VTSEDLANAAALEVAAEWVRLCLSPPSKEVIGAALVERAGVRVVVTICADDGRRPEAAQPERRLTNLQRDVLEAAPSRLHNPVSIKKLATLAGYHYGGHFRGAINQLIEWGLLIRLPGGVRKA